MTTLFVTIQSYRFIYKNGTYAVVQHDRSVIERIFFVHEQIEKDFNKYLFGDMEIHNHLYRAKRKAQLYGLIEIEKHIDSLIDTYADGNITHFQIFDEEEEIHSQYRNTKHKNEYLPLVKDFRELLEDISCYKNHLKINPKNIRSLN